MKGVLLVNLGSPDSPTHKDVKTYLDQFLMDEKVIDFPKWIRTFLVKRIILKTRPQKSAEAYKKIWWKEGSPLIVISKRLIRKIQKRISTPISLGMRYGNPSIKSGIENLVNNGVNEILFVPLYPQYAMASTETILDLCETLKNKYFSDIEFNYLPAFYNKPEYIKVLGNSILESLKGKKWEHILFSYHGIHERHIRKSDITKSHCKIDSKCCLNHSDAHEFCYRHQCVMTTKKVAEYLRLKEGTFSTSFQSRVSILGSWLRPYTDRAVSDFAKKGIKKLAIVTPAFVSDCLETLEEIAIEAANDFKDKGGSKLHVVPCINYRDDWVQVLSRWIDDWALSKVNN